MQNRTRFYTVLARFGVTKRQLGITAHGLRHQYANDRYEVGATGYLDVITAQQSLLASQRQEAQLLGQRLLVSVFLVKALGGDWNP